MDIERNMNGGFLYFAAAFQLCYFIIVPSFCQNVEPKGSSVSSEYSNLNPSQSNRRSAITATSLDQVPAESNFQVPLWIDPFASGTYSQSQTPFFDWESLMSSSRVQIPTVQFGEGIPVNSVKKIDDRGKDRELNVTIKAIDNIHRSADSNVPPHALPSLPSNDNIQSVHKLGVHPTPPQNHQLPYLKQAIDLEGNYGVDPSLISPDNPAAWDPSLLSPDNPAHADLIDFMITKDMAQGMHEITVDKTGFEHNSLDHQTLNIFPEGPSHDITTPMSDILDLPLTTIENGSLETSKHDKLTKKQQRQEKQQQKKVEQQLRKEMKLQQQKQKQELRQQAKEKQKETKLLRQQAKQKVFSEKLVAQKQKQKELRLQQKIAKQLTKLEQLQTDSNNYEIKPTTQIP